MKVIALRHGMSFFSFGPGLRFNAAHFKQTLTLVVYLRFGKLQIHAAQPIARRVQQTARSGG
jgi:hypothetical protein